MRHGALDGRIPSTPISLSDLPVGHTHVASARRPTSAACRPKSAQARHASGGAPAGWHAGATRWGPAISMHGQVTGATPCWRSSTGACRGGCLARVCIWPTCCARRAAHGTLHTCVARPMLHMATLLCNRTSHTGWHASSACGWHEDGPAHLFWLAHVVEWPPR